MPRYIDAEELHHAIVNKGQSSTRYKLGECWELNGQEIREILDNVPTVEVEPIRHGRWIRGVSKGFPKNPTCLWYCSCCGEKIKYFDTLRTYQKSKKPVNEVNPRCRKCGAIMDLEDGEEDAAN